jgi:FKBP-type peptidyl-prolyl cis-trans isomerase
MAELNQYFVQKDREIIESYTERKGLKMTESPTGLWYLVVKAGSGNLFRDNDKVIINYECDLLDGTRCYSSGTSGPKEVTIGKSKVEQGLNEGLKLLRPGAEAIFIIPPHLGFGLLGDGGKIPPRAILIYSVNVPALK